MENESVDRERRFLGRMLGLLGGGAILKACSPNAEGEALRSSVAAAAGTSILWVDTIVSTGGSDTTYLKHYGGGDSLIAIALGYHAPGDEGGGIFRWYASAPGPVDDGIVFKNDAASGFWMRVDPGPINIKWFGAVPSLTDVAAANVLAIQAAINFVLAGDYRNGTTAPGGVVLFPPGKFYINAPLIIQPLIGFTYGSGDASVTYDAPLDASADAGTPNLGVSRTAEGITLQGQASAFHGTSYATLVWTGSAPSSGSPQAMLKISGSAVGEINNLGFDARLAVPMCLQLTTLVRNSSGGLIQEVSGSSWTIRGCLFRAATEYNVLLGEPDEEQSPGMQDLQNIAFFNCNFFPADTGGASTKAHLRQRGQNVFTTSLYSCRLNGDAPMSGTSPVGAPKFGISLASGGMCCYGMNSDGIGLADVLVSSFKRDSSAPGTMPGPQYVGGLSVHGWYSQSKSFLFRNDSIDTDGSALTTPTPSANPAMPIVLSGVTHNDHNSTPDSSRFSVKWNPSTATGAGTLTLHACTFFHDVSIDNSESEVFVNGIGFPSGLSPTPKITGTYGTSRVTGTWFDGGKIRSRVATGSLISQSVSETNSNGVNQIEGETIAVSSGATASLGGVALCGTLFISINNGLGGIGGSFYLAAGAASAGNAVLVATDPFGFLQGATVPIGGTVPSFSGKLGIYFQEASPATAGTFKIKNGFGYTVNVRVVLLGWGEHS